MEKCTFSPYNASFIEFSHCRRRYANSGKSVRHILLQKFRFAGGLNKVDRHFGETVEFLDTPDSQENLVPVHLSQPDTTLGVRVLLRVEGCTFLAVCLVDLVVKAAGRVGFEDEGDVLVARRVGEHSDVVGAEVDPERRLGGARNPQI